MKKFLLFALGVLASAMLLLLAEDYACRRLIFANTCSNQYKMWRLYKGWQKGEVPILGSSRAESGIMPSVLGDNYFNYGLSGSLQSETLRYLREILKRGTSEPIVINLDPWGITASDRTCGDYSFVETKLADFGTWPGVRTFGKFRQALGGYVNLKTSGSKVMDNGAEFYRFARTREEWQYMLDHMSPGTFGVDSAVMDEYDRILAALHPPIVFVVTPIAEEWWDKFAGKEELKNLTARLAACPNTFVLDFAHDHNYPYTYFQDLSHLNAEGGRVFGETLRQALDALPLR